MGSAFTRPVKRKNMLLRHRFSLTALGTQAERTGPASLSGRMKRRSHGSLWYLKALGSLAGQERAYSQRREDTPGFLPSDPSFLVFSHASRSVRVRLHFLEATDVQDRFPHKTLVCSAGALQIGGHATWIRACTLCRSPAGTCLALRTIAVVC
jgi:hypothetical protein